MDNLKKDAFEFVKEFEPIKKSINRDKISLEKRTFPYGVINAIISHFSVTQIPLNVNESMIDRCKKGFDFMEINENSPYYELHPLEIIMIEHENVKLNKVLELMLGFVKHLKKRE